MAIAILQFFSLFSTVSPGLVILPLLIVLAITALKDGYEDIKRHQSDRQVNNSQVRVLVGGDFVNPNAMEPKSKTFVRGLVPNYTRRPKKSKQAKGNDAEPATQDRTDMLERGAPPEGISTYPPQQGDHEEINDGREYDDEPLETSDGGLFHHHHGSTRPHWKLTAWEDVKVGDFVKIVDNESIPADILICATSEEENVAFIETKNLDGETNLKSRNASPALTHLRNAQACADKHSSFRVDCDRPETNLYRINAAVVTPPEQKTPVDINMMLLRGTVLRNTAWAVGLVLYTGEDTKIVMNSGDTPSKRSKVERQMNPQVYVLTSTPFEIH